MSVMKTYPEYEKNNVVLVEVFPKSLLSQEKKQSPVLQIIPQEQGWDVILEQDCPLREVLKGVGLQLPHGHGVLRNHRIIGFEETITHGDRLVILPIPLAGG